MKNNLISLIGNESFEMIFKKLKQVYEEYLTNGKFISLSEISILIKESFEEKNSLIESSSNRTNSILLNKIPDIYCVFLNEKLNSNLIS